MHFVILVVRDWLKRNYGSRTSRQRKAGEVAEWGEHGNGKGDVGYPFVAPARGNPERVRGVNLSVAASESVGGM